MSISIDGERTTAFRVEVQRRQAAWFTTAVQPDLVRTAGRSRWSVISRTAHSHCLRRSIQPVTLAVDGQRRDLPVCRRPGPSALGHNEAEIEESGQTSRSRSRWMSGAPSAAGHLQRDHEAANERVHRTRAGLREPSWSPDGRYFAAEKTNGAGRDIVVLDARNGAEVARLTTDGDSFSPTWSPNGDQIAYLHRDGLDVDLVITVAPRPGALTRLDRRR